MDSGVHRFNRNVRKGQWRPVCADRMTGRAFSPAATEPSGEAEGVYLTFWRGHGHAWFKNPLAGRNRSLHARPSSCKEKDVVYFGVRRRAAPVARIATANG